MTIFFYKYTSIAFVDFIIKGFQLVRHTRLKSTLRNCLLLIANCSLLIGCTGSSEAFLEKAKEQLQKGNAKDAVGYLNQAIDKDPENARAFNMRGAANFELKDYASALLDYEKAIKLDPKDYKPYFNRASVKMEKSDWEGALSDCSKASEIQPDTSEIYVKRGMIHAALLKVPEAINDFDKALKLNPKETNALYNRGNIYFQTKDFENAEKDFLTAVKVDSRFAKAFYGLSIVQQQMKKNDEACMNMKMANRLGYADAKTALDSFCK
jgi:tetratricopeptide (TPR) repeat protein